MVNIKNFLINPFIYGGSYCSGTSLNSLDNHNVIIGQLFSKITKGKLEVPIQLIPTMSRLYSENKEEYKQISASLYYSDEDSARTSTTIIKKIFSHRSGLVKLNIPKEEIIYGGRGIILNKDYKPILLYTVSIENFSTGAIANAEHLNVRIDPSVYKKKTAFDKYLIDKVIPIFLEESIISNSYYSKIGTNHELTPRIIIESISSFITYPASPENPLTFAKDVQNFIKKKDILNDIILGL